MDYFKNKKILVTGHSGFKGSWLTLWLSLTGASIFGISNNLNKKNIFKNHLQNRVKSFNIDITNFKSFKTTLNHIKQTIFFIWLHNQLSLNLIKILLILFTPIQLALSIY